MQWYNYLSAFCAGMFLANFVPHFVKGICGDMFPSPFAKPPGKGPSKPVVNVLWALFNLVIGFILFRKAKISMDDDLSLLIFLAGIAAISLMGATNFAKKEKM